MNYKERLSPVKVLILGAVNGLIVGWAIENARLAYENHQMSQAAREQFAQRYAHSDVWGDFIEARWDLEVPLLSILVFTVGAYLIYECLLNRPRLLLIFLFGLGIFALSMSYFMPTLNPDLVSLLSLLGMVTAVCLIHHLWKKRPNSLALFCAINGMSSVIVGAAGIQLLGAIFWWRNVRSPVIWLILLVGVIAISTVYGAVIQFILNRIKGRKLNETTVQ